MTYNLITDGSVLAYASCGGWAYILQGTGNEKQRAGILWDSGVNQCELWGIVEGLSIISKPSDVKIFTDSYYVIRGFKKGKYRQDLLWRELYLLAIIHNIEFVKVGKGRSDSRHTKAHHLAREAVFNAVRQVRQFKSSNSQLQHAKRKFQYRCIKYRRTDSRDVINLDYTGTD